MRTDSATRLAQTGGRDLPFPWDSRRVRHSLPQAFGTSGSSDPDASQARVTHPDSHRQPRMLGGSPLPGLLTLWAGYGSNGKGISTSSCPIIALVPVNLTKKARIRRLGSCLLVFDQMVFAPSPGARVSEGVCKARIVQAQVMLESHPIVYSLRSYTPG